MASALARHTAVFGGGTAVDSHSGDVVLHHTLVYQMESQHTVAQSVVSLHTVPLAQKQPHSAVHHDGLSCRGFDRLCVAAPAVQHSGVPHSARAYGPSGKLPYSPT